MSSEEPAETISPGTEAKYKRLLLAAKRSINDLKSKLDDKSAEITSLAKRAQRRIDELEGEAEDAREAAAEAAARYAKAQAAVAKCDQTPTGVEHRYETSSGQRWCLASFQTDDGGGDQATAWLEEHELYRLAGSADELPFSLPPLAPTAPELEQLQRAASALSKVQDEFRRYRVRSEVMRKQAQAELERVSTNNLKYKQHNIVGEDMRSQLDHALEKIDELCADRRLAEQRELNASKETENLRAQLAQSEAAVQQWRRHHEQREQRRAAATGHGDATNGQDSAAAASRASQFDKLRREYDNYRKRALAVVEQKDREIAEVKERLANATSRTGPAGGHGDGTEGVHESGNQAATATPTPPDLPAGHGATPTRPQRRPGSTGRRPPGMDMTYLKNIVLQYIASVSEDDGNDQMKHMEAAIATVLRFTQNEMAYIADKRASVTKTSAAWGLWS